MKARLVVVGRDRNEPIVDAANVYAERIRRYFPFEVVEVKEEPLKKNRSVAQVQLAEAERVEAALSGFSKRIALDGNGKAFSSVALSKKVERFMQDAVSVGLMIGGPSGLDPDLVRRADESWSLSQMTLPHRIARLILCEQLYRAATILRNEPYHK